MDVVGFLVFQQEARGCSQFWKGIWGNLLSCKNGATPHFQLPEGTWDFSLLPEE